MFKRHSAYLPSTGRKEAAAPSVRLNKIMYEQFKSILVDEMSIDPKLITMDAELTADLGINSLELADLILLCEEKLGVEIDDKQLSKFISVGDIVNYLSSLE